MLKKFELLAIVALLVSRNPSIFNSTIFLLLFDLGFKIGEKIDRTFLFENLLPDKLSSK